MPERTDKFDVDVVRESWNVAADAYTEGQASGRDYYRLEFFGPAHVAACGEIAGLRVLDLGCGSGYFAREMARRGADVTAVDLSPRMIEHAERIETESPLGIRYLVCDAAGLDGHLPAAAFDMVTSCMALQDMPRIPRVLEQAARVLKPGGRLVVSIVHPCTDTPFREWARDEAGGKRWLCIDRYFERGPLIYRWKRWEYEFTTPAMHATLEDWFGWFLGAGFTLVRLLEPTPSDRALEARPELEDAARVPYYLLLDFVLPGSPGRLEARG